MNIIEMAKTLAFKATDKKINDSNHKRYQKEFETRLMAGVAISIMARLSKMFNEDRDIKLTGKQFLNMQKEEFAKLNKEMEEMKNDK